MTTSADGRSPPRRGAPSHLLRAMPEVDPIARHALSLGAATPHLGRGAFRVRARTALARRITRAIATGSLAAGLVFGAAIVPSIARADTYEVTTLADSGPGSLRQAVLDANDLVGPDTITFASSLSGQITLTSGELFVDDTVTIIGPGEDVLSVSGNDASRIFRLYDIGNGPVAISGLTLRDGAASDGGAVYIYSSHLVLESVTVTSSTATGRGGAIAGDFDGSGSLVMNDCTITDNAAGSTGGGLSITSAGATTITHSTFANNTSLGDGGGIYVRFDGASSGGDLEVRASTISGNSAGDDGGGLVVRGYYQSPSVSIIGSVISGNEATDGVGGGAFVQAMGGVTVTQTTIADNTSTGAGGGLDVQYSGHLDLSNVTFSGNATDGDGGGLRADNTPLDLTNATFSGNRATDDGGGLFIASDATLRESTFTLNTADSGGGIAMFGGDVSVLNTIVSGNTATTGTDVYAYYGSLEIGHCLIGVTTDLPYVDVGGVLIGMDPLLGPLADNGGITKTHAPLEGSPLIDAGNLDTANALDQRGRPRIQGSSLDIGAVEGLTPDVLVTTSTEPAGANCALGGIRIVGGVDLDLDGVLDDVEIRETSYVCNAASTLVGAVRTTAEPAGTNCEFGGQRIDGGLDDDGNGTLDDGEIDVTSYICGEKQKGGGCAATPGTTDQSSPAWAAIIAAVAAVFGRRRKRS